MGKSAKQYERLDALEREFKERLLSELPAVVQGQNTLLFLATRFKPIDYPKYLHSQLTDDLIEKADEIIKLRGLLSEPTDISLAHRFVNYCQNAFDLDDHHRGGPRTLAIKLLQEIERSFA